MLIEGKKQNLLINIFALSKFEGNIWVYNIEG